jgi:hypothetical protein
MKGNPCHISFSTPKLARSAELARRGIPSHAWVHVLVEGTPGDELPMAAIAQAAAVWPEPD